MEERGNEQTSEWSLYVLIIMGIVAAIIIAIILFVVKIINSTAFWQIAYSRDLGMTNDMLMASRGDVELRYDFVKVKSQLVLIMTDGYVIISNYGEGKKIEEYKKTGMSFHYAKDLNHPVFSQWSDFFIKSKYFSISKSNTKFQITEEPLKDEPCTEIDTKKSPENITISLEYKESIGIGSKGISKTFREKLEQGFTRQKYNVAQSAVTGADLSILIIEEPYVQQEIIQYKYSGTFEKADKLRCLIQNELISKTTLKGYDLTRINPDQASKMGNPKIGIIIITNNPDDNLAESIINGVMNYYRL